MLGRLITARMKAAEQALDAGRLDEALRLASASDLAGQVRVQRVMAALGERLFERAESHFKSDRLDEALEDLAKAAAAGCQPARVHDLRVIVSGAIEAKRRLVAEQHAKLDQARDRIAAGSLRAAREILLDASPDTSAGRLQGQIADRTARAEQLLQEVATLIDQDCWTPAIERWREAQRLHPKHVELPRWERTIVDAIVDQVRADLVAGRLTRAADRMAVLDGCGESHPGRREVAAALNQLHLAASAMAGGRFESARRALLGLRPVIAEATWLEATCDHLRECDERVTQLHGGPLGLLMVHGASVVEPDRRLVQPAAAVHPTATHRLPERLLIWIDGAGSYLVLRAARAWIGRAATQNPPAIPLMADLSEQHAEIRRIDDDYFLDAGRVVNVAGENLRHRLLQDGDRIVLARRAKLVFRVPSRQSPSAVLDLGDSARMANDVRRIILFDRFVTISRSASAHMVVPTAGEVLVLFERDGRLWIRHRDNPANLAPQPVELGQSLELAGVRMLVEAWQTPGSSHTA